MERDPVGFAQVSVRASESSCGDRSGLRSGFEGQCRDHEGFGEGMRGIVWGS